MSAKHVSFLADLCSINPNIGRKIGMQAAELEAVLAERTQQMSEAETTLKLKEMEFERRVTKLQKEHAIKVATVLHQVAAVVPAGVFSDTTAVVPAGMSPATAVVPASTSTDTAATAHGTAYLPSTLLWEKSDYCVCIIFSPALLRLHMETNKCSKEIAEKI